MTKQVLIILCLGIIPMQAGILTCIYTKCIMAARFVCSPIRMMIAPFFVLNLTAEKDLQVFQPAYTLEKKIQEEAVASFKFDDLKECDALYRKAYTQLYLKMMPRATQHDTLSLWERIFTDRQQELDKYCRAISTTLP